MPLNTVCYCRAGGFGEHRWDRGSVSQSHPMVREVAFVSRVHFRIRRVWRSRYVDCGIRDQFLLHFSFSISFLPHLAYRIFQLLGSVGIEDFVSIICLLLSRTFSRSRPHIRIPQLDHNLRYSSIAIITRPSDQTTFRCRSL